VSIKAVFFDLDGVLVFSKGVWFHLMNAAAREFGASPISRATLDEYWGQGIREDVTQLFLHRSVEEVEGYYNDHFLDHVEHLEVEPDAARVFAALKRAGIPTAVITNTPTSMAHGILAAAGLSPATVVGGTDVAAPKPAPDMVRFALVRLNVAPGEAIVIGDTTYDREAADAAGVPFAGYQLDGGGVRLSGLGEVLQLVGINEGKGHRGG
jgi:phosphoglycolate phosphatase/AHBA synthesis associated protein